MLIVVDSGVWISALQFGGIPLKAIRIAMSHQIVICAGIEFEVRKTFQNKFGSNPQDTSKLMQSYLETALRVELNNEVHGQCRDPKDDFILECAMISNADLIVSGDGDLKELKEFRGIPILDPRQFVDKFDR